ncbi:AGE family epimerase/isomerase [Bdellovibrio svalbardensis]|uniref:AGE family epimerase/isomerase n=1 Tax=Bdellovibrio svalbardensis TaxID=2972972 RepID=A0ABT6DDV4_9BACT|nr:AGE family epimerase/isomerase [Bdellovibrio svalbardensis]MDG0815016.1 AGE family epimerase/isomerase [Bdellovibrio svalbardensis]
MTNSPAQFIEKSKQWLTQDVYPLWNQKGIDKEKGGFVESITFTGEPMDVPRRAMVQSRQIYSFLTGYKLGCCPKEIAYAAIEQGTRYMVERFSLPSGAFIYSINPDGTPKSRNPDLYTQAFALFGLAQAYSIAPNEEIKNRAKALVKYLQRERKVKGGGYTELDEKGGVSYKSNPHMHLFESAVAWMQVDQDQEWKDLGHELITLATTKFIDPQTQVLGEYFDESWNHLRENGKFIYEPGHQYEWAWLMSLYQDLTGQDLKATRHQLFLLAEKYGTSPTRKVVFDEMWSDYTPKTQSSRFWPQCERIKAAVRLGTEVSSEQKALYAKGADEAMGTLFKFFETPMKGMWFDMLSETDTFNANSAKASSLYHIVNAMEEYINFRLKI